MCYDRYRHEDEARDAARRGYMNYDERRQYERGNSSWGEYDSCDRVFAEAYDREERRIEERHKQERQEQEAQERYDHERRVEEFRWAQEMAQLEYEQQRCWPQEPTP